VHVIADRHPVHRSKAVRAWLQDNTERVELHLMPGYSPELNPDEVLNADLKRNVNASRARNVDRLAHAKFDAKTSKEVGRAEKSVDYVNPDGTHTTVLSKVPVSVRDDKGAWQAVDSRLTEDRGSKRAKAGLHQLKPEFAASAEDRRLVTLEPINLGGPGQRISVALEGARRVARQTKDSKASYVDVLPDTDLEYEVEPGSVKESIVVKKPSATSSWAFRMDLGALTPSLQDDGVLIKDTKGSVVASLPPIVTWDSSGSAEDNKAPAQTGGTYGLK
ncbi:transposase, partial [Saccharothrix sp.]|uniref:transposase n=1 Tax=Saccharothrix sp. TaxID=1873460 RepID=UPI0028111BB8